MNLPGEVVINKGIKPSTQAVFKEDFGLLLPKSSGKEIEQNVEIYNNVFAPIKQGEKVGEVTFKSEGNIIGKTDLIVNEEIDKYGFGKMAQKVYTNWFSMLRK